MPEHLTKRLDRGCAHAEIGRDDLAEAGRRQRRTEFLVGGESVAAEARPQNDNTDVAVGPLGDGFQGSDRSALMRRTMIGDDQSRCEYTEDEGGRRTDGQP